MGLFDIFKKRDAERTDRFAPVSKGDDVLLPQQVAQLPSILQRITGEILYIEDASDQMLPECAAFLPHLQGEFHQDPKLAMLHGLGKAHAWIRVPHLRDALSRSSSSIRDYASLFDALTAAGYHVRRIRYVYFRSDLGKRKT
jgi:hypothetical protein